MEGKMVNVVGEGNERDRYTCQQWIDHALMSFNYHTLHIQNDILMRYLRS